MAPRSYKNFGSIISYDSPKPIYVRDCPDNRVSSSLVHRKGFADASGGLCWRIGRALLVHRKGALLVHRKGALLMNREGFADASGGLC